MKNIVFIRHGKSSWSHNLPDIDRPLKKRGVNDAFLIGNKLKEIDFKADVIYSSPANRAFSTCKIIMECIETPIEEVVIEHELYDFSGHEVLKFIQNLPDSINDVIIFGHNYAFTSIVNALGDKYIDNLPTTGLVLIKFDTNFWKDLKNGKTELIIFPKELKTNHI